MVFRREDTFKLRNKDEMQGCHANCHLFIESLRDEGGEMFLMGASTFQAYKQKSVITFNVKVCF